MPWSAKHLIAASRICSGLVAVGCVSIGRGSEASSINPDCPRRCVRRFRIDRRLGAPPRLAPGPATPLPVAQEILSRATEFAPWRHVGPALHAHRRGRRSWLPDRRSVDVPEQTRIRPGANLGRFDPMRRACPLLGEVLDRNASGRTRHAQARRATARGKTVARRVTPAGRHWLARQLCACASSG